MRESGQRQHFDRRHNIDQAGCIDPDILFLHGVLARADEIPLHNQQPHVRLHDAGQCLYACHRREFSPHHLCGLAGSVLYPDRHQCRYITVLHFVLLATHLLEEAWQPAEIGLHLSVRLFQNPPVHVRPDTHSHGPLLGWLLIPMAVYIYNHDHCCRRVIIYHIHPLGVVWSNPAATRSDTCIAKCAIDGSGHHLRAQCKPLLWPCRRLAINSIPHLCLREFCP